MPPPDLPPPPATPPLPPDRPAVPPHQPAPAAPPTVPACYKHPDRMAGATCRRCNQPICPECMVQAPVGWQCRKCVKQSSKTSPVTRGVPRSAGPLGRSKITPMVIALIAVNVVAFVLSGFGSAAVLNRFGLEPWQIQAGQTYRLLTSAFLHLNILHIALNMFTLAVVGTAVETILGKVRFVALYLIAALGGSVVAYLISPEISNAVGASGAIFGLMGAYFVLARHHGLDVGAIASLIVINVIYSFAVPGIGWQDHLGGLVVGAAVAYGFSLSSHTKPPMRTLWEIATCALMFAVLAALLLLPPGHVNWSWSLNL